MGHERVGTLPKSQRWRDIVDQIATSAGASTEVADIARKTIESVRQRLDAVQTDPGVQAAFTFLLALSIASRSPDPRQRIAELGLPEPHSLSPLALAKAVRAWVGPQSISAEYRELAQAATTDALAYWAGKNKPGELPFSELNNQLGIWQGAGTGAGFCELARSFFASMTERYLTYFLDREASSVLSTIGARDKFGHNLEEHVNVISQHAFETAKITQSFAAGWYNGHVREVMPSRTEVGAFLAVAFNKMRDELLREGER